MILLDTSILIDALRGYDPSRLALQAARGSGETFAASVLTRSEILVGMRAGEKARVQRLLDTLQWLAVDQAIADRAGEHGRRLRRSHPGLGLLDLLIGATAEIAGADLWTRNVKHFPMFRGLRPPYT